MKSIVAKSRKDLIDLIESEIRIFGSNCSLNHIDVSNVTNMSELFTGSEERRCFNGDIGKWNVSEVKTMSWMFVDSQFNGDISEWDVSKVKTMDWMFSGSAFNRNIEKWDVTSVLNFAYMFSASPFNGDISEWKVGSSAYYKSDDIIGMFEDSEFHGKIEKWKVSEGELKKAFGRSYEKYVSRKEQGCLNQLFGNAENSTQMKSRTL